MSFFKDFKEDFSQAVDELMPGGDTITENVEPTNAKEETVVDTLSDDTKAQEELANLDALLEKVTSGEKKVQTIDVENDAKVEEELEMAVEGNNQILETMGAPVNVPPVAQAPVMNQAPQMNTAQSRPQATDEVTVITAGTIIHGNIESSGSLDVSGTIEGDVSCNGKLTVTGAVKGNSISDEFFADAARIDGEVTSSGTVKIGLGSVVIGNIAANSAVIAGAIKGDIDVHGPVVVDTSAVVMGNIKSRSVQINNGAVIEGFCSQTYADIDVASLFGEKKGN